MLAICQRHVQIGALNRTVVLARLAIKFCQNQFFWLHFQTEPLPNRGACEAGDGEEGAVDGGVERGGVFCDVI